jgi:hypothetical protein
MSVIKSDMTPEQEKALLETWQPPSSHAIAFKRRVFELECWIENQKRYVHEEEIIAWAMRHFGVDRPQARKYLAAVVEDFKRVGVPVLKS